MCGIFGVISTNHWLSIAQKNFIEAATVVGQLRGSDGTGLVMYSSKNKVRMFKRALCGVDFLRSKTGESAVKALSKASVVIGHNRKTTSGGDEDEDCHPFIFDKVVGVHNGTIPPGVISKMDVKPCTSLVDSAQVLSAINNSKNPIDVLSNIYNGAYALTWINYKTGELCIARNKDRPLWAADGGTGMYFASEPGMLFWLMSRFNLQAKTSKLYELTPMHLYTIPLNNPRKLRREKYTVSYPKRSYTPYNSPNRNYVGGAFGNHGVWTAKDNKDTQTHIYVKNLHILDEDYPALKHISAIVRSNIDRVNKSYLDNGRVGPTQLKKVDMVVTKVTKTYNNTKYPTLSGYILDETGSDEVIPVQMLSVKDDGYDFINRFSRLIKLKSMFTVRGDLRNMRVCADGALVIMLGLDTVWSDESNIKIDDDVEIAGLIVDEAVDLGVNKYPVGKLKGMWEKLSKEKALVN